MSTAPKRWNFTWKEGFTLGREELMSCTPRATFPLQLEVVPPPCPVQQGFLIAVSLKHTPLSSQSRCGVEHAH